MAHLKRAVALFAEVGEGATGARSRDLDAGRLVTGRSARPTQQRVEEDPLEPVGVGLDRDADLVGLPGRAPCDQPHRRPARPVTGIRSIRTTSGWRAATAASTSHR